MRLRAPASLRRHPRLTACAVGAAVLAVLVGGRSLSSSGGTSSGEPSFDPGLQGQQLQGHELQGDEQAPRAILSRLWFDRYPDQARDKVRLWIWLAGGIGITEYGSSYDAHFELFEFERQGDKVSMVFFQERKKAEAQFKIERCDDLPPFDLCLTLDQSPRGPRKLYGFGYDEDLALHVPWGPAAQRIARERALTVKR
jgi:hypothetical protein